MFGNGFHDIEKGAPAAVDLVENGDKDEEDDQVVWDGVIWG